MSDTHIGGATLEGISTMVRLQRAYEKFALLYPEMDAIVTVGDITEDGTLEEYNTYKSIMNQYSTAKNNLLSMGNHDNFQITGDAAVERFSSVFGSKATDDKVINGYHFITVSTKDDEYNTTTYKDHKTWLDGRLAAANAEDPRKPIFVFIHHTMASTGLIGSKQAEAVGDGDLYDVFKKYSQVVTFSGHSHVSTADPRNIWQGDYTALNCGAVHYAAVDCTHLLTKGKTDNAVDVDFAQAPTNRGESSTALIVEVRGTVVTVRRIDNYWNVEIPTTFVFDTSVDKSNFPYLEAKRIAASSAPQFAPGAKIILDKVMDKAVEYTLPQAFTNSSTRPDDGAYTYSVTIKEVGGNVVSDILLQAENFMLPRRATVSHKTPYNTLQPDTSYEITIKPIGFFGKVGAAITATFKTYEEGQGPVRESFPIPVAFLPGANLLPSTGVPMNMFIGMLATGFTLADVTTMFGEPVFFRDAALSQPFTGTDMIDINTIIHSIIPLESLLSLVGA
jgi:3',5'-cyclic AMP phosphodiesterase CpdA